MPTHPLSLNFYSSLSKAEPEAMQEIQDNTSVVDPYSNLPNELVRSYLVVPTCLMELLWKFSHLVLGGWKVEPFVCVSWLASFWKWSERIWWHRYYGSSTLGTREFFLECVSSPQLNRYSFFILPFKRAKYVDLMGTKDTTQVMHTTKLKDGSKRAMKLS
jgi:hypothetical protein